MSQQFTPITPQNSELGFNLHLQGQPSPWSRKIFDDCLTKPYFAYYLQSDLECDSKIVGYFIGMKVVDEVTLMDIGVVKKSQGHGFGRRLLNYCIELSEAENVKQIWLEVRESNTSAISLYESVGFNVIETRHDYYVNAEGKEDAFIMCLQLAW